MQWSFPFQSSDNCKIDSTFGFFFTSSTSISFIGYQDTFLFITMLLNFVGVFLLSSCAAGGMERKGIISIRLKRWMKTKPKCRASTLPFTQEHNCVKLLCKMASSKSYYNMDLSVCCNKYEVAEAVVISSSVFCALSFLFREKYKNRNSF